MAAEQQKRKKSQIKIACRAIVPPCYYAVLVLCVIIIKHIIYIYNTLIILISRRRKNTIIIIMLCIYSATFSSSLAVCVAVSVYVRNFCLIFFFLYSKRKSICIMKTYAQRRTTKSANLMAMMKPIVLHLLLYMLWIQYVCTQFISMSNI